MTMSKWSIICFWWLFGMMGALFPATPPASDPAPEHSAVVTEADPPLVRKIFAATRQKKHVDELRFLDEADVLLDQGVDVNLRDGYGRTALHWTVLGCSRVDKDPLMEAYLALTEYLIMSGADITARDVFGNTPMMYQEFSPHELLAQALIDGGAEGEDDYDVGARFQRLWNQLTDDVHRQDWAAVRRQVDMDLPAGLVMRVRLRSEVSSRHSLPGDIVEGVLIAPLVVNGDLKVRSGTRILGTVMAAARSHGTDRRAELVIDMANIDQGEGRITSLFSRVIDVDNARETVRAGRIIGIPYPHDGFDRISWGARMVGRAFPVFGYILTAGLYGFQKTYHREIEYLSGTDLLVEILLPERLPWVEGGPAWPEMPSSESLNHVVQSAPVRTTTSGGQPADLVNVAFIGKKDQIQRAFHSAGWSTAASLGIRSGLKTFLATIRHRGYHEAPMSKLFLDGREPDLVFQKQNNTFAKRHHLRIWRTDQTLDDQPVWLAAATHDIGIAVLKKGTHWIHRIDPHLDLEREKVAADLCFSGQVQGMALLDRPDAPREDFNATGDRIFTDGRLLVLDLKEIPVAEVREPTRPVHFLESLLGESPHLR